MAQFNIEKLSLSCKEREKEEQKRLYRRKMLLVLIHHYLNEHGYLQAADFLKDDVNFNLDDYSICDNVHLESIIQDYESYFFLKYQKMPQVIKKSVEDETYKVSKKSKSNRYHKILKPSNNIKNNSVVVEDCCEKDAFKNVQNSKSINITEDGNKRILEPLGSFEQYSNDWRSMAEIILQDMHSMNINTKWEDIVGHDRAKDLLKEAIIYPIKYRELYSSISPWKSMLLYGPSGTGKTLLATAAASESGAMFFKICLSTLISKWRGESEKLIKVLFDLAKHYAPSIIFIDEIDALLSHRGEDHEASRRMKTELFLQLDALFSSDKLVFVLSATNLPWQLDHAILRRLEKRILIPYPDEDCRILLFKKFLPPSLKVTADVEMKMDLDYHKLAEVTINYSASDIESFCKESKMNYIRQIVKALELKSAGIEQLNTAIASLNTTDILQTINKIKSTGSELCRKYDEWQHKHGSE